MGGCPACGAANAAEARYCASCGVALGGQATADPLAASGHESRRAVTVLFADVVGSTALAESLDPEATRAVLTRFYDLARTTMERHGGTVEKYIGDAVMAVFGIPELHEDDALRAARAALELRDAMATTELSIRIGVNTGGVVVGDPADGTTLVTGDAVNVASRLQAASEPGTILLGPETQRLLRGVAEIETIEPLSLKGVSEPVPAGRLVKIIGGDRRRSDGPFVGRTTELSTLRSAFEAAVGEGRPTLVTIVGPPGAGKSRLIAEFRSEIDRRATILAGRCLSYGEGITYWPIAEIVRQVAGIGDDDDPGQARARISDRLAGDPDGTTIAGRVAAAIGVDTTDAIPEETPWAIRRMFEIVAADGPLVVIVDDIQWAEPALLDLLEYVLGWAASVALLIVCLARPEFRDKRPDWGETLASATLIRLASLDMGDTGFLLDALAGDPLPEAVRERIVRISDGNPLFAEELLAMLLDEGHLRRDGADGWTVAADVDRLAIPPTIGALLSARLDRLPPDERGVLSRSSVVGEQFDRGAALELADPPDRAAVPGRLLALVRRELLRPDRSDLLGGEAFRFRHLLVRDAAYEALPKAERAILHERLAEWLVRVAGDRIGEIEAIVGYHYEQARAYRLELSVDDPRAAGLGRRAVEHLVAAGRGSMEIGDMAAAANVLARAIDHLDRSDPQRVELAGILGIALFEIGQGATARSVTSAALEDARRIGDERLILHAEVDAATAQAFTSEFADACKDAHRLAASFSELGDTLGEAKAWQLIGIGEWFAYRVAAAETAIDRARTLARRGRDRRLERQVLAWGLRAYGPKPVSLGIAEAEAEIQAAEDDRVRRVAALTDLALLHAYEGDLARARMEIREAQAMFSELGRRVFEASAHEFDAFIEMQGGDLGQGVIGLERGVAALERLDDVIYLPFDLALLSYCYAAIGDRENADRVLSRHAALDSGADLLATSFRERALAHLALARDDQAAALRHAERGVAVIDGIDMLAFLADALMDEAMVHRAGRDDGAAQASAERALSLYRAKEHRVGVDRASRFLDTNGT